MSIQPPLRTDPTATYTPSPWRARWYRLKRLCSRIFRRKPRFDVNQALKEQRWQGIEIGKGAYLGHCPHHEKEMLQEGSQGHFTCFECESDVYTRHLWMPEIREPRTDPHQLQITMPTQRPLHVYRQAVKDGAGTSTATLAAIPKWLVRLREKPKEKK